MMASPENSLPLFQDTFLALPPSAFIRQAIEIMTQTRESCVFIIEDLKLVGIVTERDIVRITANNDLDKDRTLAEVMTRDIITARVSEAQDIFALSRLLSKKQIRHLPIVDDRSNLVGIVTPQSIRKFLKPEYLLRYIRAVDVMEKQVIYGLPDESVMVVARRMARHRISCIVIINEQTFAPVGIITERDVVRFHQMGLDFDRSLARDVMSAPLSTMLPQESLWNVNQRMQELKVRRLVISYPTAELAGIVTQSQIMKMLDPAEIYHVMNQMQEVIDRQTRELQKLNHKLKTANAELAHLSTIDALTQVVNRRKFDNFLAYHWKQLSIRSKPLSLILCDVDRFKGYNDTYGHLAGDECLVKIARAIREATRTSSDLVARYGGEEFAVVLPNTDSVGADRVAQDIILRIQDLQIPHKHSTGTGFITVSLGGVTVIPDLSRPVETVLQHADRLLYQAKHQGRNTYIIQDLTANK